MHRSTWAAPIARWATALALMLGALPPSAAAEPVRLMVAGIEKQIYLPVVLADRLGYFSEQGLAVQLLSEPSGVNAEDELLAGGVQGVVGFYDHTVNLQAKGKFVQAVVQFSRSPGEAEIVATRMAAVIRSPADFGGHTLGVTGLGSSTHALTQYLAVSRGVRPGALNFVAVGSGEAFVAALRHGQIEAGMTTEPTVSRLLKSGEARLLVDLRTPAVAEAALGGIYPGACLYMSTLWVDTHRPQVQQLVNALVKALRYIETHSAEEIADQLPQSYRSGDSAGYVAALRDSKAMFIADGAMPPTGPDTVLRVLKAIHRAVQVKTIDLSRTYTNQFVSLAP